MRKFATRLSVLLLLGFMVVFGAVGYLRYFHAFRFWFPQPVGEGPAGPSVPAKPFAEPWSERPVVLFAWGDSVTAGFGARPGYTYVDRLEKNSPDEFADMQGKCLSAVFPDLEKVNIAVSGSNSIEHVREQLPEIQTFPKEKFGLVVLTTGGNDIIHWYGRTPPKEGAMYGATLEQAKPWIANFRERLETMIAGITEKFPGGCAIFLANIYDPSDGVGNPAAAGLPPFEDMLEILDAYNRHIKALVKKHDHVFLVDIRTPFLGHGVHCIQFWREHYDASDPAYWYSENLEDPNERGYDAIRRIFLNAMLREKDTLVSMLQRKAARRGGGSQHRTE